MSSCKSDNVLQLHALKAAGCRKRGGCRSAHCLSTELASILYICSLLSILDVSETHNCAPARCSRRLNCCRLPQRHISVRHLVTAILHAAAASAAFATT